MKKNPFPYTPEQLNQVREIPLSKAIRLINFQYKVDPAFKPKKSIKTQCWHVSNHEGYVYELLVNGEKWYDRRENKGGGGAIDLVMHLTNKKITEVVKLLLNKQSEHTFESDVF